MPSRNFCHRVLEGVLGERSAGIEAAGDAAVPSQGGNHAVERTPGKYIRQVKVENVVTLDDVRVSLADGADQFLEHFRFGELLPVENTLPARAVPEGDEDDPVPRP